MIGVLLFSRSPRTSSWAAVRGSKEILVSGTREGDLVRIRLKGNSHDGVEFMAMGDSKFEIPDGTEQIQAQHEEASGGDVCVEMN